MTVSAPPRIVDLSFPIRSSPEGTPAFQQVSISYSDNAAGAREAEQLTGVPRRLMRNGEAWATETFTQLGTHSTTHVDEPLNQRNAQPLDLDYSM